MFNFTAFAVDSGVTISKSLNSEIPKPILPLIENDFLLEDLLQELEEVTDIATRTKLNIDYVPGMVTLLQGHDMQEQGIHSLEEALSTVPGVEVTVSNDGRKTYVMRGIGKSFSSSKVKILINGHSMNAAMSASGTLALIPMQLVERVEVVRGPGSAIYGEYAYAGVINIITKKDSRLFYTGSLHNKHTAGGIWSNNQSSEKLKYSLLFSAYESEGKQAKTGEDFLVNIETPIEDTNTILNRISNSPGYSNEAERIFISNLQMSYKDLQWDTYFQHQQVGDYFGFQNSLPPENSLIRKMIVGSSDIDKKFAITDKLTGEGAVGGRFLMLRSGIHTFFPAGFPVADPDTGFPTGEKFENGVLGSPNYTETEIHGDLKFEYKGIKNHELLLGFRGTYIKQGDTWAERNTEFVGDSNVIAKIPLQVQRGEDNWLTENNKRLIASAYVQDQWRISSPLLITYGGRLDHYVEYGNNFNPRLAGVYTPFDNHIFKMQYSEAFRPPTFLELYAQNNIVATGNTDIRPETIKSIETNYVYKNIITGTHLKFTLFYSHLNDLISHNESNQYENLVSTVSRGYEFEFSQKLTDSFKIKGNGSIIDIHNHNTGRSLPGVASVLGNTTLVYKPVAAMSFLFSGQYIGERKREENDQRESLEAYLIFNSSLSWRDVFVKKINIYFGIKNIFDKAVLHPAPLKSFGPTKIILPSYAGDYPRPGREVWLNIEYLY